MNNSIAKPTLAQLEMQTAQYNAALNGITEEQGNRQPQQGMNSIRWIAGHLLNTRYIIRKNLTDLPTDLTLVKYFGRGSTGQLDENAPTLDEIVQRWNSFAPELQELLNGVSEEKWHAAPAIQMAIPDETFAGFVAYMAVHEAMHLGQISILKKL